MSDNPEHPNKTPQEALEAIRAKLEKLTREYAAGVINSAQFNALYRHHSEKRAVIERILESNPASASWRTVAEKGNTAFLRNQYESRTLYFVVFRRGSKIPLLAEGKIPRKAAEQVIKLLQTIWAMSTWRKGLARKSLGDGLWLLLNIGENALTLAVYFLQPSTIQTNKLRDFHEDFERANKLSLQRDLGAERMVFPQRALLGRN